MAGEVEYDNNSKNLDKWLADEIESVKYDEAIDDERKGI